MRIRIIRQERPIHRLHFLQESGRKSNKYTKDIMPEIMEKCPQNLVMILLSKRVTFFIFSLLRKNNHLGHIYYLSLNQDRLEPAQ